MNMRTWLQGIVASETKKPMPVLSFPAVQLLDITVPELIGSSENMANGMKAVADRVDMMAGLSYMDLSLEAEAFGCQIKVSDDEVPTVVGTLIETQEQAEALQVPGLDAGRISISVRAMEQAVTKITDRPVFAGMIGPFSLAGRLLDVSKALIYTKKNPQILYTVLEKVTDFQIQYAKALKATGCHGVFMAEPLAGLLSPRTTVKFSEPYVKRIADAVKSEDFLVLYHNCGNAAGKQVESILRTGCDAYHFGNAIDIKAVLEQVPEDTVIMGNIDPAAQFTRGTAESMRQATQELMEACGKHKNFIPSSGCDIPPAASWDNVDTFFETVREYYEHRTA